MEGLQTCTSSDAVANSQVFVICHHLTIFFRGLWRTRVPGMRRPWIRYWEVSLGRFKGWNLRQGQKHTNRGRISACSLHRARVNPRGLSFSSQVVPGSDVTFKIVLIKYGDYPFSRTFSSKFALAFSSNNCVVSLGNTDMSP